MNEKDNGWVNSRANRYPPARTGGRGATDERPAWTDRGIVAVAHSSGCVQRALWCPAPPLFWSNSPARKEYPSRHLDKNTSPDQIHPEVKGEIYSGAASSRPRMGCAVLLRQQMGRCAQLGKNPRVKRSWACNSACPQPLCLLRELEHATLRDSP